MTPALAELIERLEGSTRVLGPGVIIVSGTDAMTLISAIREREDALREIALDCRVCRRIARRALGEK